MHLHVPSFGQFSSFLKRLTFCRRVTITQHHLHSWDSKLKLYSGIDLDCSCLQEWIPDSVWLNVVALSSMTALHDIPDSVFRNDGLWRQWYDAEAPETANVPDYEDRLSKFERMCVVKVSHSSSYAPCACHMREPWLQLLSADL